MFNMSTPPLFLQDVLELGGQLTTDIIPPCAGVDVSFPRLQIHINMIVNW